MINPPSTWGFPTFVVLISVLLAILFWFKLSRVLSSPPPSGVQRSLEDHLDVPVAAVADAVRAILTRYPAYRETIETDKDGLFKTKVKPRFKPLGWLMLSTDMTIELQPLVGVGGTKVIVTTKSQWYITGDIFDIYRRYLRDFLKDLGKEVQILHKG